MSRKIKFHAFHILFRLFAYLADKSGGWRVFVRPKLLLGSVILGIIAYGQATEQNKITKTTNKNEPFKPDSIINGKEILDTTEVVEEKVFCYVTEQMPQYPNGDVELMQFLSTNLKYPQDAINKKIEGKVVCRFLVNKDGTVSDVKVIRSLYPSIDNEAIRVLKMLPKWTPGKQNGEFASVSYTIPITFKLPK